MAAIFFRPWRFFRCFLLCFSGSKLALAEGLFQQLSDAQEAFGRRSCKFRPLPSNLSEGYVTPEGAYEVAETFGVPLAVLVGAGHRLQATVPDVALMGFTVQLPFHGSVQVVVEATVGQRTLKCTHTWGAGGHMKQCGLTRIQLPPGPVTLTFRATGLGVGVSTGEPGACLTLRLDLEISSHKASESARMCFQSALPAAAPPLLSVSGSGDASIPVTTFSSPAPNGVIWKAALPAAQANNFNRLFARVTFPSMVHPVRLLIEELKPWTSIGDEPKCLRRCFTGTATAHGQVLQRLLPPAMPFALWILSDDHDGSGIAGGHCANYDFELQIGPVPMSSMAQDFLGPAAWLCEGGAWPRRLEQSTDGIFMTERQVLRQRRFALRDHFDLTRPPDVETTSAAPGSLGGLHAIEIQVSEASIFRLTTHAPTVPARPVLVPGRQDEAWLALSNPNNEILTRRIPAAGREFRHSISTELSPGEYTLLFVLEMPTGGLRPCASLLLNLLLEPLVAGAVQSCASDAGNGILDLQAMAEPLPVTAWRTLANSFTVTLPRPVGSFEEGAGDAQGLQIIARSSMNLGYSATDPSAPPVMLHAKVTSPFSTADLQVTFYENGQPLGEPIPLADGNGYRATAGPVVKDAFYEVVLFHVPRTPSSRTHCVDFDVELAAVSLTPPTAQGQFIAPLPGAENCWSGDQLPAVIRVREGESTVLEGNFQLPPDGHRIQFIASSAVLLRVSVSSRDAEVRVGQEPLQFLGLAEDRFFHRGPAGTLSIRTRSTGRAEHLCPVLRMHLVVVSAVGNGKAKQLQFRPLSLVICNGRLFMSSASWILERHDGPAPVWKGVIDISKIRNDGKLAEEVGGIRGMTAVQSPTGTGSSILFCWNPNSTSKSWILRCDFDGEKKLMQPIEETSINAEAKKYLQTEDLAYTLAAYNNMLPSQVGKHQCNLIGFEIVVYGGGLKKLQLDQVKEKHAYWAGAGIACRVNGHDYFVIEVGGVGGTGQALTAVRCFENSPFPEEPNTIYFGGYDCNSCPSNHTAWIWKCTPA